MKYNLPLYKFSSIRVSDPYYILGVEKRSDYEEIKKVYYKLVSQFHPDRNPSPDAAKQFMLIKESFEIIQMERGQMVQMEFETRRPNRSSFQSARPNPQQYNEDFQSSEEKRYQGQEDDYKQYAEYAHRTPEGEEFDKFQTSFQTLHDIKDIKLSVQDVDLPDPSNQRVAIKNFSDSGNLFILAIIVAFTAVFYLINGSHNEMVKSHYENIIYNLLNRHQYEELKKDQDIQSRVIAETKQISQFQKFEKKFQDDKFRQEIKRRQSAPIIHEYVTTSSLEEQ